MWGYTPREIAGFLMLLALRRRREAGEQLAIAASATRGDEKELKRQIRLLGA